ncbi:MAG TPA: DUF3710 domain-containing protein [Jiangellaceae bacterium]|jgi:Protein of unknown function (DUF3710)|nr:DUF3710 domain-containing protein [Jiangellaceae bacterium]
MVFRRRRRRGDDAASDLGGQTDASEPPPVEPPGKTPRPDGPFDVSEIDLADPQVTRIDLGGLLVQPTEGMRLQIQVDERSRTGAGVMMVDGDAAVVMIGVAAPRSSGLWEQTRGQIAADAAGRGGTVQEAPGPFGTELRLVVPVTTADGAKAVQASRVVGIDGPRWMLRATFLGTATTDAKAFARLVKVVRETVVVRGDRPMAPGEVIPVNPPPAPTTGQPAQDE